MINAQFNRLATVCLSSFVAFFFVFSLQAQVNSPEKFFSNYDIKTLDVDQLTSQLKNDDNGIFTMQLDEWSLQMELMPLLAPDYRSVDDKGQVTTYGAREIFPLSGYNAQGGRASITLAENFIFGYVEDGKKTYYYEPLSYYQSGAKANEFIRYEIGDIKDTGEKTCGFQEVQKKKREILPAEKLLTGLCYDLEYGICNDFSMIDKYGSTAAAELHVIGVTNNVNTNYDDEFDDEIRFVITGQYNVTTMGGDPWSSSTDVDILLGSFATWASANLASAPISIAHDIASLWSDRDFDGTTIGYAFTPGVCNSGSKYNILQDFNSNANLLRVLVAHELGHNLDANHDEGTTTFIMSPSVSNVTLWSATSIADIDAYIDAAGCLSICAGSVPQVNFNELTSSAGEASGAGTGGPCLEPYTEITRTINISIAPTADVVVNIAVAGGGTADNLYDYELSTASLTFTAAGALSQTITLRIYDDQVEEEAETFTLAMSIGSGSATVGPFNQTTITISDNDEVSGICCSDGPENTYGNYNFNFPALFIGDVSDARSRFILTAAQLTSAGLTAGYINSNSIRVISKTSTGPFQNFRMGLLEVTESSLSGTPWYNTEEVYSGDLTTATGWNKIDFTNNFLWNGTSNIYFEYCFDNAVAVGNDVIAGTAITQSTSVAFLTSNSQSGCSLTPGSTTFYNNIHPQLRFTQTIGSEVATAVNSTSSARIQVDETAHFYTTGNELIASIKNTGSTDMECIDVTINTAGTAKLTLPASADEYTNKTFQVSADGSSTYELTLYFTNAELAIWAADTLALNFIQSSVALASSTAGNRTTITTLEANNAVGSGTNFSYRTTVEGDGFFALTNGLNELPYSEVDNADFVIETLGSGLLMKNSAGDQYLVSLVAGEISVALDNGTSAGTVLMNSDLHLVTAGKGIIFRSDASNYSALVLGNDGNPALSSLSSLPAARVEVTTGHFGLDNNGAGIVFKNSENECWNWYIDAGGNLVIVAIACP